MSGPSPAILDTHVAIVGASGAGKTVTAKGHVEALLDARRHVCVMDPTGAWYGLRSNAAGDGPGFDIPIFGGPRGDVAITAEQGEDIGAIIAGGVSAIVDLSALRTGSEQRKFARDLCRRLRAKPDGNFHLVVDEADEFAAQKPRDDYGFQVGEELIWMAKRGRLAGFVLSLVTQRPASIDKEVLSQAQTLIVHQLLSPVDQKPIVDYLRDHADAATLKAIKSSLASLDRGERWIYAPRQGLLERGVSPMPATFDSSRTPAPGEQAVEPKMLASIDMEAIRKALAVAQPEPKKEQDCQPDTDCASCELLRQRIETHVALARGREGNIKRLIAERDRLLLRLNSIRELLHEIPAQGGGGPEVDEGQTEGRAIIALRSAPRAKPQRLRQEPQGVTAGETAVSRSGLPGPQQRILDALAWWAAFGHFQPSNEQVAFIAGYSPTSTGYTNPRGALRSAGLIEYPIGNHVEATEAGRNAARQPEAVPTGNVLRERVLAKLPGPQQRILSALIADYPNALTNADCAANAGYSHTSTGYTNPRGALRSLDIIDYPSAGMVRAKDWLFPLPGESA